MAAMTLACNEAGCTLVGGHTIEASMAVMGLSVSAITRRTNIKLKAGAMPEDVLILTKPLGIGIAIAAHQLGVLSENNLAEALSIARMSNSFGEILGATPDVHAMTDITGFGLLGHALEIAQASNVSLHINFNAVPLLNGITAAARELVIPALAYSNFDYIAKKTTFIKSIHEHEKLILCDPQTNGGLLVAVSPERAEAVLLQAKEAGLFSSIIGRVAALHENQFITIWSD